MSDVIYELVATEVARDKLAARNISPAEAEQVPRNEHWIVRNPREGGEPGKRRLLVGETDGGRALTLVIERTVDPTTWLVESGWSATAGERKIDPRYVESHAGNPDAKLRMLISVEGEDVVRLERIAQARGKKPGDVVADLLPAADRSAA